MSKKDDVFTDNPELFTTGSFKEIATKINNEWWEDKRKQLSRLSGSLNTDLIEFLPEELRQGLLGSPEEFDEENPPDDSFLLHTFKKEKGKGFEVRCSNSLIKDTMKITKKEKEETIEILHSLSAEPSGSSLDRPNNVKMMNKQGKRTLEKTFGVSSRSGSSTIFYQYKCGQSLRKRLIWTIEENLKRVVLLFYGTRERLNKVWA